MGIDFFEGSGYAEGKVSTFSMGFNVAKTDGEEIVYDFATMERGKFEFNETSLLDPNWVPPTPGFTTAGLEIATMLYNVHLEKFDSQQDLAGEYSGYFLGHTIGIGDSPLKRLKPSFVGIGKIYVSSSELVGSGDYTAKGFGVSPIPVLAFSLSATDYKLVSLKKYASNLGVSDKEVQQIKDDIRSGTDSPWPPTSANWYTRIRAINELEELWQKHRYYFEHRYRGYQK